jgi:hypothetical protein
MTRRVRNFGIWGLAGLLLAGFASTPAQAHRSGCTRRIVDYAVTGVTLHERIDARWSYGTPDFDDRAQLQTAEVANADWHGHKRNAANFVELSGQCRIGDWRQGHVWAAADTRTNLAGTWSAGQRSGSCTNDRVIPRSLPIDFVRQTLALEPPASTIGVKWTLPQPRVLDCPFTAFDRRFDEYHRAHPTSATFEYPTPTQMIPKSTLLGHSKLVRLSVHLRAHAHPVYDSPPWDYGNVNATLELTATVTLVRYKDCTIHPADRILNNPCLRP